MRAAFLGGGQGRHPRPNPQPRPPLPPFDDRPDPSGQSLTLHTTLPANWTMPPSHMRGDFWGVSIPGGLPFVPGGTSSVHPERCLTWFLDEYQKRDVTAIDRCLTAMALRGYNTIKLQRGGGFFQQSPFEQAAQAAYIRSWGFDILFMCSSKNGPIDVGDSGQADRIWGAVQPYLGALLERDALQRSCIAWEAGLFWNPNELQKFKELHARFLEGTSVRRGCHFPTFQTAWQLPGHLRADFWTDRILDDCYYQTHPTLPLRTLQAHLNDAMVPASGLQAAGVSLVLDEVDAQAEFDGPESEDYANMRTYGLLCTPGPILVTDWGSGCRNRDGSVM